MDEASPQKDGRLPEKDGWFPLKDGRFPKKDEGFPKKDGPSPQRDEGFPKIGERFPRRDGRRFRAAAWAPVSAPGLPGAALLPELTLLPLSPFGPPLVP